MSQGLGTAQYRSDGRIVFLSIGVYLVAAVLGGIAYFGGTAVGNETAALAAAIVVPVGFLVLFFDRARSARYEFRGSTLVEEMDPLVGGSRTEVPYDDVAFVTRERSRRQAWLGVASFELVRADADDLTLKYVGPPEAVETELRSRLPTPDEWLDAHEDRDTALHATVRELHHWRYGERLGYDRDEEYDDENLVNGEVGAATVVTHDELTDVIGVQTDSIDLNELDDIDGVSGVNDIAAGDVGHGGDAGDHDAGGFDGDAGGRFDGGGGGGGGGDI